MRTTLPSKPSSRSVSAAFAPANAAPAITNVRSSIACSFRQREELGAGARVLPDQPVKSGRGRSRAGLLHPAQRHAHVLRVKYDADTLGPEPALEPVRHLRGQPLLHLQIAGEQVDDACQLGQADDALVGYV